MYCKVCGSVKEGIAFDKWVKPTFTSYDKLKFPSGDTICNECLFWFNESSEELQNKVNTQKPQRMRNYSHFIKLGEWYPLSKAHKDKMRDLLFISPFPELAAIAETGQKHIVFQAKRNQMSSSAGWVQFEESSIFIYPKSLQNLVETVTELSTGFSKASILSGEYDSKYIINFGYKKFIFLENKIKQHRSTPLLNLAVFLSTKEDNINE